MACPRDVHITGNALSVDTNRGVLHSGNVALNVNAAWRDLVPADAYARRDEVPRVRVRLEADEVRAEHAVEDLLAPRETPEDLGGREGRVHEEADGGVWKRLTEERRDEEQVVVVDPDQVAGPVHLCDALREGDVDGLVRGPVRVCRGVLGCDILPEQIVEQRPERYVQ